MSTAGKLNGMDHPPACLQSAKSYGICHTNFKLFPTFLSTHWWYLLTIAWHFLCCFLRSVIPNTAIWKNVRPWQSCLISLVIVKPETELGQKTILLESAWIMWILSNIWEFEICWNQFNFDKKPVFTMVDWLKQHFAQCSTFCPPQKSCKYHHKKVMFELNS